MKKLLLLTSLLAGAFVILGGMNVLHDERESNDSKISNDEVSTVYSAKYKDCIDKGDFPENFVSETGKEMAKSGWDIKKVNSSVAKYKKSMEATIKNLNYIDAHTFIHQEFQRSKNLLLNGELSEIQKHYHREVMRICYASDKSLNLGSEASRL